MPNEPDVSHILSSPLVSKLISRIGTIAGSAVGLATLAFAGGFLAQRAQYDFAQVPFVFVDYWSYAEIGVMAYVRSIYVLIESPGAIGVIAGGSVALVLLIEFEWFRRLTLRPPLVFMSYVVLVVALIGVIRQQLEVRSLRYEAPSSTRFSAQRVGAGTRRVDTVPAVFPFTLSMTDPLQLPAAEGIVFPRSAVDGWNEIADELEMQLDSGAQYQDLRPAPDWALTPKGHTANATNGRTYLLGQPVPAEGLDANRAVELYGLILSAFALLLWLFFVNGAWLERIHIDVLTQDPPSSTSVTGNLLIRLREEVWYAAKWVLRPLAAVLLVTSGVFLMPECFGILTMARIGQEYVQVVTHTGDKQSGVTPTEGGDDHQTSGRFVTLLTDQALELLQRCPAVSVDSRKEIARTWTEIVQALEEDGSPLAAKSLEQLANASGAVAPELVNVARDAWARVSTRTSATYEGYILYYPRSETDYLRLLRRDALSPENPWSIYPVAMTSIVDIRLKRDTKTLRLIELLRGMEVLSAEQRVARLLDAEHLGHPRLLEVAIAATFDRSHTVRGPSITDIGRYAANLPHNETAALRRAVAVKRLTEVLQDPGEQRNLRTAAASALSRFVAAGDGPVCGQLEAMLEGQRAFPDQDARNVASSIISTLGKLRCSRSASTLGQMLLDPVVPDEVRTYIPTAMETLGADDFSANTLAEVIADEDSSVWLMRPTLGAISDLRPTDPSRVIEALCGFLSRPAYPEKMLGYGLASEYRGTAIVALRRLGDPRAIPTLIGVAKSESVVSVKISAIDALGQLGSDDVEAVLIDILLDPGEDENVQTAAARALGRFRSQESTHLLARMYDGGTASTQAAILDALKERADNGSGFAETLLAELLDREQDMEDEIAQSGSTY